MGRLDGKVAMITGAAGGIGRAAARLFAAEGARLTLADLDRSGLEALADELGHERVEVAVADMAEGAAVKDCVARSLERFGGLEAALLNAGIEGRVAPLVEQSDEDFERVMAVNVRGVWLGLKHIMPAMEAKGGSIVVTSSTAGIRALAGLGPYTCSKHAVIGLMRTAAVEGAARGIRVNAVNPAPTETAMIARLEQGYGAGEAEVQPLAAAIPLGRYGRPEEVARVMLFLASAESSYCTGGVYMVDGGVSAGRR